MEPDLLRLRMPCERLPDQARFGHLASLDAARHYQTIHARQALEDRADGSCLAQSRDALRARLVSVAHRQIAATRNSGAREANGEMFIFVDADTIVNEAVVGAAVAAMRDGAVGGGAGVELEGAVPLYARLLMPVLVRWFRVARLAAGCFFFCSRSAFVTVGGFDEAFYGAEELVLSRALKGQGKFVILPQAVTTSGRKLRTHSVGEMLKVLCRVAFRGPRAVKQRQGLELWYAERREDPQKNA